MDRRHVENGIHRSWAFVEELGLAETFSNPGCLEVSEEWRDLTLKDDTTYVKLYLRGLSLSHYNFCLKDYSFFQFGWEERNVVRYAFFPNPFVTNQSAVEDFKRRQELVESGLLTLEEYLALLRDSPPEGRVPLLRYENAPAQWKELRHPCSHLHVGYHAENRWAVSRILTPLAFTMFVAKQYYIAEWRTCGDDESQPGGNRFEGVLIGERSQCYALGDDCFSELERQSFHFG
jgi:hypothetical protein